MSKNDYYVIQGEDYKQMAIQILQAAGVAADIKDKTKKVGIKPNLVAAKKASDGAVTHPELVDGVLAYLKAEGFMDLAVLEGSWVGDLTSQAVRVSGIYDICKKHQVIPYIRMASRLGVGSTDVAHANMIQLREGMPEKKIHCSKRVSKLAAYANAKDACSACYGSLIYALDRLNDEGILSGHKAGSIAIGQAYRGKTGDIGIGQCTGCFEKNLGGCPPKAVDIAGFLRKQWD